MRMESEDIRALPLHMQEQVGVALVEQMEQAAQVAEDAGINSGLAAEILAQNMSYGDYIRSLNDEQLADYLVELQITSIHRVLSSIEISDVEEWKQDLTEGLSKRIQY